MDNRLFAKHLKNPEGEVGKAVGVVMNKTNMYMNKYTYSCMKINEGDEVLEIGFGNGKFIPELFTEYKDFKYTGIEISKVMLEEAQKNIPANLKDKVNLTLTNQNKIDFTDESFDKICTINTIYFWDNPKEYLLEIKRVLKTGGEFFLSIRSKVVLENQDFTTHYFRLFNNDEIKKMLEDTGFSDINIDIQLESDNPSLDIILITCKK